MKLTEAMASRFSARAFIDTPVDRQTVYSILDLARQCPSGSNIQPWKVHVVTGEARTILIERAIAYAEENPIGAGAQGNPIHPREFVQPYKTRRFQCGMRLYEALGIDRKDKAARQAQLMRNFYFFDAPVGLIFSLHKSLLPGQLGDLGIFMGNVMLAARQFDLHTCAQGFWQDVSPAVHEVLDIPEDYLVYNGMALGKIDPDSPANHLDMGREEVDGFTEFLGFS
ncbi:MAG: nitroreductase [Porticoccaceae bacterium]